MAFIVQNSLRASEVEFDVREPAAIGPTGEINDENRLSKSKTPESSRRPLLLLVTIFFIFAFIATNGFVAGKTEVTTDYLNTRPGVEYVGDEICRQCHLTKYESFKRTGMGRSMSRPDVGKLDQPSTPITVHSEKDGRVYTVQVKDGKLFHSESQLDSKLQPVFTETHEIAYSVGSGNHGRSYLIERGDFLFVSPLSFYTSVGKWDFSPGHESGLYRGFTRPAGGLCVSCHSGLSQAVPGTTNQYRQPTFPILSIGCERCHGPGAIHVAERRAGKPLAATIDRSIVNPRNLPARLRDDVCYQCHLAGDARVQMPGKNALDFRPATSLNDVVAIFQVPSKLKVGGFQVLSQPEQIQMSRCRQVDGTQLNCITCHDPHVQKPGAESAKHFDGKCVTCHATEKPVFVRAHRSYKSAPGSCTACHMPKAKVTNIVHTALTDHRIPKNPKLDESSLSGADPDPLTNLIWATRPVDAAKPDLRTLALAFAQLAPNYPGYGERGFPLLERAALEFPKDPDVQITHGEVLLAISKDFRSRAKQAFERAIRAGSKSTTARRRLAKLMLEDGSAQEAVALLLEVIQMQPYDAGAYLQLAGAYIEIGRRTEAISTLERVLSFDPGNSDVRKRLSELRR